MGGSNNLAAHGQQRAARGIDGSLHVTWFRRAK
jgi:hypothetical protein